MKKTALFTVLFIAFCLGSGNAAGKKAPGFALMNNNGKFVYKSRLNGNLIVSFWSSYCKPCKKEMPYLVEFEKKYGGSNNVKLILINTDINDSKGSAKEKAADTLEDIGVSHDYLMDPYHMALKKYNPKKSVPATFLIDRNGRIVYESIGFHENTLMKLEYFIKRLK